MARGHDQAPATGTTLHGITTEQRLMAGLRHLNVFARDLLTEASLEVLLVRIVDAAKELARADFSALILLAEGSEEEIAHFAYNAPRELFPQTLPRAVGLLAAPIKSRSVVRVDDVRGHPAGAGIPAGYPPMAALLAVPILLGEVVIGEVAVANRPDKAGFDDIDEALMAELASHTAIAVSLITARRAQQRVQETREELEALALHNLHTPLTVAQEALATLRHHGAELSEEERSRSFEAIERAHEHIQALTEGALLDEPTPSGGTSFQEVTCIDVAELMQEIAADLGAVRDDVRVETAVEEGWPPRFAGDRRLVRELLDNLVTNAVKHSPAGEVVWVTARREGGSVRFDVTDRGPGIPPEEQGRIFEQFYRTAQSVADEMPGAGLGLWIARRLANLQGGRVGVSSRTGQGATFWATVPLEPPLRPAPAPE